MTIAGANLFVFAFNMSSGGTMFPYMSDFVPPALLTYLGIIRWTIGALIVKFSLNLLESVGTLSVFLFTGIYSFVAAFLFAAYGYETNNKSDLEIHNGFKYKRFFSTKNGKGNKE